MTVSLARRTVRIMTKAANNRQARRGRRNVVRLDLTLTGDLAELFFDLRDLTLSHGTDRSFALTYLGQVMRKDVTRLKRKQEQDGR